MITVRDILVVEDEPLVTRAVVMVCSEEGMTVTAMDNGVEALRHLVRREHLARLA